MNSVLKAGGVAAAVALLGAGAALACGDKLVVLGGGIPFEHVHTARHAGNVILFLNPSSRLPAANAEFGIDKSLARAGHTVRAVQTSSELRAALQTARADLVLMDWADARQLRSELAGAPILPVTFSGSREDGAVAQLRAECAIEASKGHGRRFMRTIETLLENEGQALPASCSAFGHAENG